MEVQKHFQKCLPYSPVIKALPQCRTQYTLFVPPISSLAGSRGLFFIHRRPFSVLPEKLFQFQQLDEKIHPVGASPAALSIRATSASIAKKTVKTKNTALAIKKTKFFIFSLSFFRIGLSSFDNLLHLFSSFLIIKRTDNLN